MIFCDFRPVRKPFLKIPARDYPPATVPEFFVPEINRKCLSQPEIQEIMGGFQGVHILLLPWNIKPLLYKLLPNIQFPSMLDIGANKIPSNGNIGKPIFIVPYKINF